MDRMLSPFPKGRFPDAHTNRFGVIPKGHNTGKWRLITDLSFPPGYLVNDGITEELKSLTYTSVYDIALHVLKLGRSTRLAKINIESAYRLVPVHPDDRLLQAMEWDGQIYIDPMLPFGLRSAPKILNTIADTLTWHLLQKGVPFIDHYLDDLIVLGPPDSPMCAFALRILDKHCARLGIPIAQHKREVPTTCLTFLGIEIDTMSLHLLLPQDKLERLSTLLDERSRKNWCIRKEPESLCVLLNHACKVVRSGRSFLRRMLDLHPRPHRGQVPIRLNAGIRPGVVSHVHPLLERRLFLALAHLSPRQRSYFRCIRFLGMRSLARPGMVPDTMGHSGSSFINCRKRARPHNYGLPRVGASLEWSPRAISL